jgi:hypothetical protein
VLFGRPWALAERTRTGLLLGRSFFFDPGPFLFKYYFFCRFLFPFFLKKNISFLLLFLFMLFPGS